MQPSYINLCSQPFLCPSSAGHFRPGKFPQKDIMNLLCQFIPGGMIAVYLEDGYPLYMVNDTLLSWLGYSYQEFLDCTGGYVERVIHPADRNKVSDAISRQLGHSSCA